MNNPAHYKWRGLAPTSKMDKITFLKYDDHTGTNVGLPPVSDHIHYRRSNLDNAPDADINSKTWQDCFIPIGCDDLVEYKYLDDIPPGQKYVVYLNWYESICDERFSPVFSFYHTGKRNEFPMPSRIWEDSYKRLVHWVIDWGDESMLLDPSLGYDVNKFSYTFNSTNSQDLTLLTAAQGSGVKEIAKKHGYNCVTSYELNHLLAAQTSYTAGEKQKLHIAQKVKDITNKKVLDHKSLCYNRLPRLNRFLTVAFIQQQRFEEECLHSLGKLDLNPTMGDSEEEKQLLSKVADKKLVNYYQKLREYNKDILPHIEEPNVDLSINQANVICYEHGLKSYFQIVTETWHYGCEWSFITEKSYKPFFQFQPFVSIGCYQNIETLRNMGFEMFDEWIDHSYDNEVDPIKRWEMGLAEFKRLQNLTLGQLNNMLYDMLPQLLHNADLVSRLPTKNVRANLFHILLQFCTRINN